MNQVKTTSLEGDVAIGRHATVGGNATVRGNATIGKDLRVDGWLEARNIKHACKGLFATEDALEERYPRPMPGWWALVGDTIPAPVYVVSDGLWKPTGKTGGETVIDLVVLKDGFASHLDDFDKFKILTQSVLDDIKNTLAGHNAAITRVSDDIELHREREYAPLFEKLKALQERFDTLADGDVSGAIDNFNEIVAFLDGLADSESLLAKLSRVKAVNPQGMEFIADAESARLSYRASDLNGSAVVVPDGWLPELPVACSHTEGGDMVRPYPGNAGIVTADDYKTIEDSRELLERAAGARFVSDVGFSANAERVSYRRDRFRLDGGHVWVDDETGDFQAIPADGLWGFPMATAEKAGAVAAAQVKAWDAARPGAFVDLCRSYGVGYDESTGLFLLNGLTITEAQMRAIVAAGVMTNDNRNNLYFGLGIRTHLPPRIHLGVTTGSYTFRQSAVETVDAKYLVPGADCFCMCSKLRRINVYSPNTANSVLYNTYKGCEALETLTVQTVYARSIWLGDSPLISLASLNGIIDKAQAGVAASTFTVHPDVYAKMLGDPETDRENGWTSLPERAAAKNITFTTTQ